MDIDANVGVDGEVDATGEHQPARRRRGAQLEDALLTAAWEELLEHGYAGLTFENVAARAHTSRPVVRRRWTDRQELARAAVAHRGQQIQREVPDTGSLRGDLLSLLGRASEGMSEMMVLFAFRLGAYFEETGSSLAELRTTYLGGRSGALGTVFECAADRGEIDRDAITPRIITLAADLVRHEMIMTLKPVPPQVLEEIVDTIVLPLVTPGGAARHGRR